MSGPHLKVPTVPFTTNKHSFQQLTKRCQAKKKQKHDHCRLSWYKYGHFHESLHISGIGFQHVEFWYSLYVDK